MICADTGDDGMNDETTELGFDVQGIKDFIVARDRQHNRFFVGRTDTIRCIAECLSLVSVRSKDKRATGHPAKGLMQLVQGAPGVGKTSLLDELTARYMAWLASGDAAHKVIPIVISNTKRLSVTQVSQQLQEGMTRVLDRVGNEEVRVLVRDVLSIVQDINLFGLRLGKPNTVEPASPRLPEDCTILLMIDEIQTVPGGPDDEPAHILQHLEAGSNGRAILPVLAGLVVRFNHMIPIFPGLHQVVRRLAPSKGTSLMFVVVCNEPFHRRHALRQRVEDGMLEPLAGQL